MKVCVPDQLVDMIRLEVGFWVEVHMMYRTSGDLPIRGGSFVIRYFIIIDRQIEALRRDECLYAGLGRHSICDLKVDEPVVVVLAVWCTHSLNEANPCLPLSHCCQTGLSLCLLSSP